MWSEVEDRPASSSVAGHASGACESGGSQDEAIVESGTLAALREALKTLQQEHRAITQENARLNEEICHLHAELNKRNARGLEKPRGLERPSLLTGHLLDSQEDSLRLLRREVCILEETNRRLKLQLSQCR